MNKKKKEAVVKKEVPIYERYTKIYSETITNYDAIHLYTIKSMLNNLKEYKVFYKKLEAASKKIKKLSKGFEDNQSDAILILDQLQSITSKMDQYDYLIHMIPSNLVVSLVTNFDQFLAKLLNFYFKEIVGQINIIEESVRYCELSDCNEKTDIQDYYINKFLNSFFRKSHEEQIEWLDKKLSTNIKTKMPNFDDFIFLCELRNLIIHNDSFPNDYFFKVIDVEAYNKKGFSIEPNKKIKFSSNNISYLFEVIHLSTTFIFTLLTQKYYDKKPDMLEAVEAEVNKNILKKLKADIPLSIMLIKNQLNLFKHSSDYVYIYKINLCIAYKKMGDLKQMNLILSEMDWSNCNDRYIYAKYILLDDKDNIVKFMKKFNEYDWKVYYQTWPLFDDLRKEDFFKEEYKKIFGEEFIYKPVDLKVTGRDIKKVEREIKKNREHSN